MKYAKVMPCMVSTPQSELLSPEQLKFYEDNGYLVIRSLFDINTVNRFRTYFTQLCEGTVKNTHVSFVKDPELFHKNLKPEDYINKIQEILYDEVYMTFTECPRMLTMISQLIGDDLTALNAMLINKPPGTSRHSPHQDLYYFPVRPGNRVLGVWTAIDRVWKDNGCLYVIPGSHKHELLYNHGEQPNEIKQFFHGIMNEEVVAPEEKWIYLEMEPGDTVIFNPYLIHGSGPNNTKFCRKAMSCHYVNSNCHYVDVTGTTQELLKNQIEAECRRRGGELSFVDVWRVKSKSVRGVKCNL